MKSVLKKTVFIAVKIVVWIIAMAACVWAMFRFHAAVLVALAPIAFRNFEGKYMHAFIGKVLVIVLGIALLSVGIVLENAMAKATTYPRILRAALYCLGGSGILFLVSVLLLQTV